MAIKKLLISLLALVPLWVSAQSPAELKEIRSNVDRHEHNAAAVSSLIALGKHYVRKPGEYKIDLDNATFLNMQAKKLSQEIGYKEGTAQSLVLEAEILREKGNRDRSYQLTEEALHYAENNKLDRETGEAYLAFTAFFNNEDEQVKKKIGFAEKGIPYLKAAHAMAEAGTALKDLGDYYQILGDYEKSIKVLEESLSIYQRVGFKEIQGVCDLLGFTYQRHGNTPLALKYGLLAVKTAEALQDSSLQLCTIYNRLALTYYIMRKNDLALEYYHKALKVAQRYKDDASIQQIEFNLVILLRRRNEPARSLATLKDLVKKYPPKDLELTISSTFLFANLYMDLNQEQLAEPYIGSLLKIRHQHAKDAVFSNFLNQPLIRYYFVTRDFPKAYPYLRANDSLLNLHHVLKSIVDNQLSWARTDSALGNYFSALRHYQRFKAGSDSLQEDNLNKQLRELQFQFDVDNKDRNIQFLTQKGQLQQNEIRAAMAERKVTIAGLIALLIVCGLIYRSYRIKKRGNALLTAKQEEINVQNEQLKASQEEINTQNEQLKVTQDEIILQNDLLKRLLDEKEWLVKEIHHRVKNNLQIVISLLNTQSAYLDNEDALFAIRNSQHRMNAISMIHQKLYQSENLAAIDMSVYIHELVDYLRESFITETHVSFSLDIAPLTIDVAQAVPLGLILNEAISNAIKYAFAGSRPRRITITLRDCGDGNYELTIADNGKGLPEGFDPEASSSLGMSLMSGLSLQLEGTLSFTNQNGLNVSVIFKPQCINLETLTL